MSYDCRQRGGRGRGGRGRGDGRGAGVGQKRRRDEDEGGAEGGGEEGNDATMEMRGEENEEDDEDEGDDEAALGMECFVADHEPIQGVLKHLYSDFLVNEVAPSGEVCMLTSQETPEKPPKPTVDVSAALAALQPLISADDLATLMKMIEKHEAGGVAEPALFKKSADKAQRTAVHMAIKAHLPFFDTLTVNDAVKVVHKRGPEKVKARNEWPKDRGKHCEFILLKENRDSFLTLSTIAKSLRINTDRLGVAGTKDKRAVTTQRVTAQFITAERLAGLKIKDAYLGNYRYVADKLELGMLAGNRFSIALREVPASDETINSAVESLREMGFVNYFGSQRFGTSAVTRTHSIGHKILQGKYLDAVNLILEPNDTKFTDSTEARKYWQQTKDVKGTLERMPRYNHVERVVLESLLHAPTAPLDALLKLPRNMKTMYLHSYQSYLWNKAVSMRLKRYGLVVVAGDLVLNKQASPEDKKNQARVVSEADVASYTIHDVVLPLAGCDVLYPSHAIGEELQNMMKADGVNLNVKHKNHEFTLMGGYRLIVEKPRDVSWSIPRYSDPNQRLQQTDIEKLKKVDPPAHEAEGPLKALCISFTLPPSTYATMCLREIMRVSTTKQGQIALARGLKRKRESAVTTTATGELRTLATTIGDVVPVPEAGDEDAGDDTDERPAKRAKTASAAVPSKASPELAEAVPHVAIPEGTATVTFATTIDDVVSVPTPTATAGEEGGFADADVEPPRKRAKTDHGDVSQSALPAPKVGAECDPLPIAKEVLKMETAHLGEAEPELTPDLVPMSSEACLVRKELEARNS